MRRRLPPQIALGGSIVALVLLTAAFAPWIAPGDPTAMHLAEALRPPGPGHPAGTDNFGRDVFTRIVQGTRLSIGASLAAVAIAGVFGTALGLVSGYLGGWVDLLVQRLVDLMLAFPGLLLALGIVAVLGPGLANVMLAVGIAGVPGFARLVRGETLAVRSREFVLAAKSAGAPAFRIVLRHVLPNVASRVAVVATLALAGAILATASLSYLGLGAQPPTPAWGTMLADGQKYIFQAWWLPTMPGLAIAVSVLGFNILGDGLQDALDPRIRRLRATDGGGSGERRGDGRGRGAA
ncbi:MAG: ABC transporter permease [Clostridia bacterium]|nr:ABC transporter permease [Clostridia bacterium]